MKVGRLFGIEITVNPTWVLVFALVAYAVASPLGPLAGKTLSLGERTALGVAGSLLFFASVLLHELAHSLLARSRGVPVRGITLFIFGGVSAMEGEPATAPAEAWISAVGPLTSLALGLLFYGLALLAGDTPPGLVLGYLAFANVVLALFNVLPAFPLDGGRVLHALVWRATGDRLRATRIAANVGAAISVLLIVAGIAEALVYGSPSGLWLTFVGWYLLQAGNVERRQSEMRSTLTGHTAVELVAPPELRVAADATAASVLQRMRDLHAGVLPVYVGERFIGFASVDDMAKVATNELATTFVTAVMTRVEQTPEIPASAPADDAVRAMGAAGSRALAVVLPDGECAGAITRESVVRWLASRLEPLP